MVKDPGVYEYKWYDYPFVWVINSLMFWHKKAGRKALPAHLRDRLHWDYIWPLKLIPRWVTSFAWGVPKKILGNQTLVRKQRGTGPKGPGPIGEPGSWQISRYPKAPLVIRYLPIYFAFTTKKGLHARIGARWDDVDGYITFPVIAIRRPRVNRKTTVKVSPKARGQ